MRLKNLEGIENPKNRDNGFTLAMRVPLLLDPARGSGVFIDGQIIV